MSKQMNIKSPSTDMKAFDIHSPNGTSDWPDYHAFLGRVAARFDLNTANGRPVFSTDAPDLWGAYMATFDAADKQHHNCNACRHFIERFADLVVIDPATGLQTSAIWNEEDAPDHYKPAIKEMARLARRANITGQFLSSDKTWGQPVTGVWHHFFAKNPKVHSHPLWTAGQVMAERKEDFKNVSRALSEYKPDTVNTALQLLDAEALYRAEKVAGPARWLAALHASPSSPRERANSIWLAVATAPAGYAHPRSSMIGTLLDDIAAGKDFDDVSRSFKAKMTPTIYQRPQAAPSSGTLAQAEKTFAAMGAERSLLRRYALLEEIQAVWRDATVKGPSSSGLFGHLLAKVSPPSASSMSIPETAITWAKFRDTVLPGLTSMDIMVPHGHANFTALVTAADMDAAPLIQWDRPELRNPFSTYLWMNGSTATQWGLSAGWAKVNAVSMQPHMWNDGAASYPNQGKGAIFVIDGARESKKAGAALFPEIIRSEFHGVRSVIEAYSKSAEIAGIKEATACGLLFNSGTNPIQVRVKVGGLERRYKIDRWD